LPSLNPNQNDDGVFVFHAGTKTTSEGETVTSGGRVLAVTAIGSSPSQVGSLPYVSSSAFLYGISLRRLSYGQAVRQAYSALDSIHFEGMNYRCDIGSFFVKNSRTLECHMHE